MLAIPAVFVLGAVFVLSERSSRFSSVAGTPPGADREEAEAMSAHRGVVRAVIADVVDRERSGRSIDEETLARVEEAAELQRRVIRESGPIPSLRDQERMEQLLRWIDVARGERLMDRIRAAEMRAEEALLERRMKDAAEAYSAAAELQAQINREHPRSPHRSARRLSRFQRSTRAVVSRPIYEASLRAEGRARRLAKAGEPEAAQARFEEAIGLQETLVREYRDTQYADLSRLEGLKRELVSLQARDLLEALESEKSEAQRLNETGRYAEAAERWGEAVRLQREINRRHGGSRHASAAQVEAYEIHRQDALGREAAARIGEQMATVRRTLREGNTLDARSLLREALGLLEGLEEHGSRATWVDPDLEEELRYLIAMGHGLRELQRLVDGHLVPLQGHPARRILDRETSQALYEAVMGENPSAVRGDVLPVESVTYLEAERFCRRLGWIMGRPVRLPAVAELRMAAGALSRQRIEQTSWHALNSEGRIRTGAGRPANALGVHDLPGNVAEWALRDPQESETAPVVGGGVREHPDRLVGFPVETHPLRERHRFRGFRFVVE